MSETLIRGGLVPPVPQHVTKELLRGDDKTEFSSVLRNAVDDINRLQRDADKAIENVQLESAQSIHEAMIALEKASISFKAMMQVRNKILEAYQEVMRMQV